MPVVVECGDELQLPPVPSTAGLFADLVNASTMHRAGVDIFRQKDYVYRLATMKRLTDPILVAVLTKMRKTGGCKLSKEEWAAMQATDISKLPAAEQQRRLQSTDLWYQSAFHLGNRCDGAGHSQQAVRYARWGYAVLHSRTRLCSESPAQFQNH